MCLVQRIDWTYLDAHLARALPVWVHYWLGQICILTLRKKHNQQVYLALLREDPPSHTSHTSLSGTCGVCCDGSLWVMRSQRA